MNQLRDGILKSYIRTKLLLADIKGEFGVGSILSIAVALIVSAFVLVPGMKTFASTIIDGMSDWWTDTVAGKIFPTS